MNATGTSGELCVAYQRAARLGAWEAQLSKGDCTIQAAVHAVDGFWITQSPLRLSLRVGNALWTWPSVAVALTTERDKVTISAVGRPHIQKEGVIV